MLFPGNKLTLKWERVYRVGAGLHNLGNTCFLNSTVQCLTYTPPLANYLLSKEHSRACEYLNQALKMQPDSGHVHSHSPIFFWKHLQSSHIVKSEISCLLLILKHLMELYRYCKGVITSNLDKCTCIKKMCFQMNCQDFPEGVMWRHLSPSATVAKTPAELMQEHDGRCLLRPARTDQSEQTGWGRP